jgi:hypothetical protein
MSMKVDYEGKTYNFELEEITVSQATVLKRRLGLTLLSLDAGLNEGDPDALRAVYWLMLDQSGERVDIDEVDFKIVKLANAVQAAADKEAEENKTEEDREAPKDE